ncbi:MAG: hypothetical protein ACXWQO_03755 [Bdellovibrionota bacterium]
MQLTETLFDKVIEDFWQSLQGTRTVAIPDFTVPAAGIPVNFSGAQAQVDFAFPLPVRTSSPVREWSLASNQLSARITVNNINATTVIDKVIDGVRIRVRVNAECHNVALRLKPGMTSLAATIRAEVLNGQVNLTMPTFNADWKQGAWEVESITCTGTEGLDGFVKQQALAALSNFENFDAEVRAEMDRQFTQWSKDASILLLSQRELPSGKDYLQLFYEPTTASEADGGLLLQGNLRFVYPYVAPGQDILQEFKLGTGAAKVSTTSIVKGKAVTKTVAVAATTTVPQILLPFASIRALMMGEYFAGQLAYSLRSYEIPAFQDFMQSRFKQFFAWPDLMKFPTNTTFAFNFVPSGPPSFENEKASDTDTISGDLVLPLWIRMFAPVDGTYTPYVEFATTLQGASKMKLLAGGKIDFQVTANQLPVTYRWAASYLAKYNPNQKIAAQTMADAAKGSLSSDGLTLSLPTFLVGKALKLVPQHWQLQTNGNLGLQFSTETGSTTVSSATK